MQNETFNGPSWQDIFNTGGRRRTTTSPGVPNTSPGIPEDQVTYLPPPPDNGDGWSPPWSPPTDNRTPPPPTAPPTPGPAIPLPLYEDMLGSDSGDSGWYFNTQYRGASGSRGSSPSPFGAYGNSGEQAGGFFGGIQDWFGNYGNGDNRGGNSGAGYNQPGDYTSAGNAGLIATGSPYLGRKRMSAADVEFWNLPADYQSAYFERIAMRSVGDYDRSEPTYDQYGNIVDPGGEIISGPKTTAIRQLMAAMAQTARSQMLSGYMPRVSY